jgi:hypothetical protein
MANKIQVRRDTTANWTSSNPTLSQGEIGYELNTGKIKIGTGTTAWNSLDYLTIATSSVTGTLTFPDATVQTTAWLGSLAYSSLTGKPTLATVATSGSYNDLSNKPNIAGTYSFNVAADDSSLKTINTNETIKFIGAGGITTASDAEGNITITGTTTAISWGDITNKTGSSGPYSVALGLNAGAGANSISLGQLAGSSSQGTNAVAIGNQSGAYSQGGSTVSIGANAGYTGQGNFAIAIGASAGQTNQGVRAIAIGFAAGDTNQATGSIILNATDVSVNSAGPGFHVAPVRQSLGVALPIAQYNTSTKELTYSDISINGNTITTTDSNVDLVLDANGEGAVNFGSIKIKRNNILGVNSNEDIVIDPSGTGTTVLVNGATISSGSLNFSGNISATAWTTNGIRHVSTPATLTDTSSTGTVTTAYTNNFGGNTIAATNAGVTYTNYGTMFVNSPTAGTNVTITNPYSIVTAGNVLVGSTGTGTITATAATATTSSTASSVGYLGMPQNSKSTTYSTVIGDVGKHIYVTSSTTITIDGSVAYPIGTTIGFISAVGVTTTIAIGTDTLYLGGTGTTGSRSLAAYGMATAVKVESGKWFISGNGLT